MTDRKERWKKYVAEGLASLAEEKNIDPENIPEITAERPPKSELGDVAFPMFPCAGIFRTAPNKIAAELAGILKRYKGGKAEASGPYVNVFYDRLEVIGEVLQTVRKEGGGYGKSDYLAGRKIMVEFSCPNTNKPLHLGHLRNNIIGECVSRVLKEAGAEVLKVNLINDRGVHICKSMLAYKQFGGEKTPETEKRKSDHFVGDYYIKYNDWLKENQAAEELAQNMLIDWEAGDPETIELWKRMNRWAIEGINETYARTGISFDRIYYESQTYLLGKDEILEGLKKGIFFRDENNAVRLDLSEIGMDTKVLLRGDGTSVYMTQDIGTAISRHKDYPFDRLIYVVASEQEYHFKVLFYALKKLGYEWADSLYHLSYGMVNLPEGKMKSREGTVVDADNLLDQLVEMAEGEIHEKERELEVDNVKDTAEKIALAAVHYFLLQTTPQKDMIFNPKESLSFTGNTGPYLQYMTTRISSMMRKAEERGMKVDGDWIRTLGKLTAPVEWELIKLIIDFPEKIKTAAAELNPSLIAGLLYDLAKNYSRYYHDYPVLANEDKDLRTARLILSGAVLQVLKNGFSLINIPFLEKM